jgi:hypothetical protein
MHRNITTIAGGGSYSYPTYSGPATGVALASPVGLALDSSADRFIADTYDNLIREMSISSGYMGRSTGHSPERRQLNRSGERQFRLALENMSPRPLDCLPARSRGWREHHEAILLRSGASGFSVPLLRSGPHFTQQIG